MFNDFQQETAELSVASILSDMEVSCPLPVSPVMPDDPDTEAAVYQSYSISLSNDGADFSEAISMTVFDSLCMECQNTGICTQKVCM